MLVCRIMFTVHEMLKFWGGLCLGRHQPSRRVCPELCSEAELFTYTPIDILCLCGLKVLHGRKEI